MAPRMDFTPSLGSTTTIPLPHITSKHIRFNFTVTLSKYWADKFVEEGRQVQVWSDIPSSTYPPKGEWHETPFVRKVSTEPAESSEGSNSEEPLYSLSIISPDIISAHDPVVENQDKVTLVAQFAIPQELTQYGARYSFTFRIAGPYGNMEWLGNMGWNGHLWVGSRAGFGPTDESEEAWSAGAQDIQDAPSATWSRSAADVAGQEICIGNFEGVQMKGWSFGPEGPLRIDSFAKVSTPSSLFVLHPEASSTSASPLFERLPSLIISSSSPTGIRLQDSRLYASSSSVTIWEPKPSSDLIVTLSTLISTATLGGYDVAFASPDNQFVAVALSPSSGELFVPNSSSPKTLYIVPVAPQTGSHIATVGIPFELIRSIQPTARAIGVASFVSGGLLSLDTSNESIQDVVIKPGASGGEVAVLPLFAIPSTKSSEDGSTASTVIGVLEPSMVTSIKVFDLNERKPVADELIDSTPNEEEAQLEVGADKLVESREEHQTEDDAKPSAEEEANAIDLGSAEQDAVPVEKEEEAEAASPPPPANSSSDITKAPPILHPSVHSFDVLLWLTILLSVVHTLVIRLESVIPSSVLPHIQWALPREREQGTPETMDIDEEPEEDLPAKEEPQPEKKVEDPVRVAEIITPPLTPPRSRQHSLLEHTETREPHIINPFDLIKLPSYALSFIIPPNARAFKLLNATPPADSLEVNLDGTKLAPVRKEFREYVTYEFEATTKTDGVVTVSFA